VSLKELCQEKSGVDASMNEDDMKDYLGLVIKELKSKSTR